MTLNTAALKASADTAYMPAYRESGTRPLSDIKYIVLHDTEGGGSAANIASYFHGSSAEGSAHLVVDDHGAYRCLADNVIPWGAPGANTDGFHIEQLGYASWTKAEWMQHDDMLHRVAYKVAQHCKLFGIPCKYRTAAAVKAGTPGVTTHLQITRSGIGGAAGTHTDPGTGYPIGYVMALAQAYLKALA